MFDRVVAFFIIKPRIFILKSQKMHGLIIFSTFVFFTSSLECKYVFVTMWLAVLTHVLSLLQELGSFTTESSSSTVETLLSPGPRPAVCPRFLGWPFLHTTLYPNFKNSKRNWKRKRNWQVKTTAFSKNKWKTCLTIICKLWVLTIKHTVLFN